MSRPRLSTMQIHINGQETFFLNEKLLSTYSEKFRKIVKQERRRGQIVRNLAIEMDDFPGGPHGFELVWRFCHNNIINNNGGIKMITTQNVCLLYCCAVFLGMTETLLQQTETFLEGMFFWSWKEIVGCLKSCESFFSYADSCGLLEKLIFALLAKIAQTQNSELSLITTSSSSSSSPETASASASGFRKAINATPESIKPSSSSKAWWFDDLTMLPPKMIEKVIQSLGAYMNKNNSLIITKFILHYLKLATHRRAYSNTSRDEFVGLADTAVHGVISSGKRSFSCRSLFWVLRILSGFGISKDCRLGLERLIGQQLHQATLDDLMVSGNNTGFYDVNLVIRLLRVFVSTTTNINHGVCVLKLNKVARLIDNYLAEISPDHNLKISKFLGVAESVPDSARDSFDGVYRAIDIYLESHGWLSWEERSKLCRCLNYKKLSLEACKELAKNPKIPPRNAIEALISHSQESKELVQMENMANKSNLYKSRSKSKSKSKSNNSDSQVNEDLKFNLHSMQTRVMELEKFCREIKGQMSRLVRHNVFGSATPTQFKPLPRLC